MHTLRGDIDRWNDLLCRPVVVDVCRICDLVMGPYRPWERREVDIVLRGNSRRGLPGSMTELHPSLRIWKRAPDRVEGGWGGNRVPGSRQTRVPGYRGTRRTIHFLLPFERLAAVGKANTGIRVTGYPCTRGIIHYLLPFYSHAKERRLKASR